MNKSSFGTHFTVTTWGESHGKALGAVVDLSLIHISTIILVAVFSPTPGIPGILSAESPIKAFNSIICGGVT